MQHFYWCLVGLSQPLRLDVACASVLPRGTGTRSQVKNSLEWVRVNGAPAKLSKKVFNGDVIEFCLKPTKPKTISLFNYPLSILYEDPNILVAYKPSGMVTHPSGGHYTKTLVNALEFYRRNKSAIADEFSASDLAFSEDSFRRPIVHRLDKDTSGLILTARNQKAKSFYVNAFKTHKIRKYYLAILDRPLTQTSGWVKTGIARSKNNRQTFNIVKLGEGKTAISRYRVVARFGQYSLVLFRIYTGRTHQIRVHAKALGARIVGDRLYSKDTKNPLMLHAYKICLPKQDGGWLVLKTGLPKRFRRFMANFVN